MIAVQNCDIQIRNRRNLAFTHGIILHASDTCNNYAVLLQNRFPFSRRDYAFDKRWWDNGTVCRGRDGARRNELHSYHAGGTAQRAVPAVWFVKGIIPFFLENFPIKKF
ncbi:MAG TPA: hypothetical protein VFC17_07320 [Candidatus Limnocylindrales bacterium]|nr:hypothetical protein [Candidatus Limnocylindrales bacterium]